MDQHLINRVAQALHEAMRHSPAFAAGGDWEDLKPNRQAEYRAVAHSALVAAGEYPWTMQRHTIELSAGTPAVSADEVKAS